MAGYDKNYQSYQSYVDKHYPVGATPDDQFMIDTIKYKLTTLPPGDPLVPSLIERLGELIEHQRKALAGEKAKEEAELGTIKIMRNSNIFGGAIVQGSPKMFTPTDYRRVLAGRLRLPDGVPFPFEHLDLHVSGSKVFVFVVNKGQASILEDDEPMFPSDTLVGQLIIIKG